MSFDPTITKALTFDIGGTVFDWHRTVSREVSALAAARGAEVDAAALANDWRRSFFQMIARVRSKELPWMNGDQVQRQSLDGVLARFPSLVLSPSERDELSYLWHRLDVWPDAAAAIERLRARYRVVVLTVLSLAEALDSSKKAGISWDAVISCEFLGHYKPDRDAYLAGVRLLGVAPDEAMMVAAHPSDLRAAMAAGLTSAYVPRPGERGPGNDGDLSPQPDFTVNARDFTDLADVLLA